MTRCAVRLPVATRFCLLLLLQACGGGGTAAGPSAASSTSSRDAGHVSDGGSSAGSNAAAGTALMTALVDGTMFRAEGSSARARTEAKIPGGYTLKGTDSGAGTPALTLSIYNVDAPGTYPFGVTASVVGAYASYALVSGAVWHTALTGDTGELTITALTPKRVAGTFKLSLTAYPGTNATGTHDVTEGQFDMPLATTATPIGAAQGRTVTGKLNGTGFNAATVVVTPLAGGFSFNALNDRYNVGFSFAGVSGPGTDNLAFDAPARSVVVIAGSMPDAKMDCCWGASADDSGSLTLTTFSPDRFVGTFELSLRPQSSSTAAAPLMVTSGQFDIGRQDP